MEGFSPLPAPAPRPSPRRCAAPPARPVGASGSAGGGRVPWVGWCPPAWLSGRGAGGLWAWITALPPVWCPSFREQGRAGVAPLLPIHLLTLGEGLCSPGWGSGQWGAPGRRLGKRQGGCLACAPRPAAPCTQGHRGSCRAPQEGHSLIWDGWVTPSSAGPQGPGTGCSQHRASTPAAPALLRCLCQQRPGAGPCVGRGGHRPLPPRHRCRHLPGHRGARFHFPTGSRGACAPPGGHGRGLSPGLFARVGAGVPVPVPLPWLRLVPCSLPAGWATSRQAAKGSSLCLRRGSTPAGTPGPTAGEATASLP